MNTLMWNSSPTRLGRTLREYIILGIGPPHRFLLEGFYEYIICGARPPHVLAGLSVNTLYVELDPPPHRFLDGRFFMNTLYLELVPPHILAGFC